MFRIYFKRFLKIRSQFSVIAVVLLILPFSLQPSHAKKPEDLNWIRLQTDDIIVFSSTDEEKTRAIVDGLLRFRDDCLAFLPVDPFKSPTPTYIYLLSDESAYENICNSSSASSGTAGVFNSAIDASYIAIDLSAGTRGLATVYHEYFHFIARHTMPTLSLWANEGLAEFFSTYEFKDGHGTIGHPIKSHVKKMWSEEPMPFVDLFGVNHRSDEYSGGHRVALFYAQSWALVHTLLTGTPAEQESFQNYLAALAQGMSAQSAMIESLDLDEKRIMDQLQRRKDNLELPVLRPEQRNAKSVIWRTDQPTSAEVLSAIGMFTVRMPRTMPEAPRHFFTEALSLAPNSYLPHLGLALVERNQRGGKSRTNFARAYELAPTEPLVLDSYGEYLTDQYDQAREQNDDTPTADIEQARDLFQASLKSNPDGARALMGYAMSFHYEDEIPEDVINALDKAIKSYPSRIDLLMAKCRYTARLGKHEEAWSLYKGDLRNKRPGRDVIQSVSTSLLNEALVDAYNTAQSGEIEEGRQILELALKRYGSKRSSKDVWEQFAEAEFYGQHNRLVDRYNQGVDAINEQEFTKALELLEEVATAAEDSTLRQLAVDACDFVRPRVK